MGSGDEIRMRFPAAGLPALPAGWRRDFLLLVDGWAKDADANTAFSQSVLAAAVPCHEPLSLPQLSIFPNNPAQRAYQEQYNTRPALRLVRPLVEQTGKP